MTSSAVGHRFPASAGSPVATGDSVEALYSLNIRRGLRSFLRQPLSFWLVCISMMFEYVRPQAIYTWLQGIPWAEILLLATPLAFVLEGARFKARNPINTWMVVFSVAVLLSWMTALYPAMSQEQMFIYVNWVMVYVLVANIVTSEVRFFIFFGLFLLASLKMSQHGARSWAFRGFSFANWGATGAPGWFHNSGEFGVQMCVFFPLSVYFIGALRPHWEKWKQVLMLALPVTAIMSLVATNSRGALIGVGAVGMWMLARSRHRARAFLALGALALVVIAVMPAETRERFQSMGDDKTSTNRLTFWRHGVEAFKDHPLSGIGYANWPRYYNENYGQVALPHNIFVQAGAEMGSVGLVALIGLIAASFVVNRRTRKLAAQLGERGRFMEMTARGLDGAMIGFIGSGFFVTVLFYPYIWFGLAMTSALHTTAVQAASSQPRSAAIPIPVATQGAGWRSAASMVHGRPGRGVILSRGNR